MLRRAPLARAVFLWAGKPMARTRIRQTKTARLRASEAVLKDAQTVVWEREGGDCWVCGARGEQVHHRQARGRGGASRNPTIHAVSALILTCEGCHNRLEHTERQSAYDDGLLVKHGIVPPELAPIRQGAFWFLLCGDGTRTPTQPPEGTTP